MNTKTNSKIRIRLESFNYELLEYSCKRMFDIAKINKAETCSIISLPTDKRIYCVLRSPHVDKDSREHFEIRIHKKVVEVNYDSTIKMFDLISDINLPSGVLSRIDLF